MKTSNRLDSSSEKKYLSIGELAARFSVSVELLRKWEKDFPRVLRPKRTSGDVRLYDQKQQNNVAMIYHLLREEGLSIEGAKKKLSNKQSEEEIRQEVISRLSSIRAQLMSIVEEIENVENESKKSSDESVAWINNSK